MSGDLFSEVRRHLGPHLLRRDFAARRPAGAVASWGCCYVAAEALYHLLGGRLAGWRPFSGRVQGEPHWWLVGPAGEVLDPTADQFAAPPDYTSGVGKGFLTRTPSRRARLLIAQVHGAIEVDPRRAFGRPVLAGTSAPAEDVAARFLAGEGVAALAADYDAPGEQIEEAIRCSLNPITIGIDTGGRLRHRDDEGSASTQAHRDLVELLREIDWRDGLIEELRSEAPRLRKERDALQSLIEELRKERDEARDARDEALIRASTWIERAEAAEARVGSKSMQLEGAFRRLERADARARAADHRAAEAEAQIERLTAGGSATGSAR